MKVIVRIVLALALLIPAAAWAQQGGGIVITSVSEIEIKKKNAEGKEEVKRVDATTVQVLPGETVVYTNQYTYNGDKPATDVFADPEKQEKPAAEPAAAPAASARHTDRRC